MPLEPDGDEPNGFELEVPGLGPTGEVEDDVPVVPFGAVPTIP